MDAPVYYPLAFILQSNWPGMAFHQEARKAIALARRAARRKVISDNCILIAIEPHTGQYIYRLLPEEPGPEFNARVREIMAVLCLYLSGRDKAAKGFPDCAKAIGRAAGNPVKRLDSLINSFQEIVV